jgi:hypothetical protein
MPIESELLAMIAELKKERDQYESWYRSECNEHVETKKKILFLKTTGLDAIHFGHNFFSVILPKPEKDRDDADRIIAAVWANFLDMLRDA